MKEFIREYWGTITFLLLAILLFFSLVFNAIKTIDDYNAIDNSRFKCIESVSKYTDIAYDTETGIEYSTSYHGGVREF